MARAYIGGLGAEPQLMVSGGAPSANACKICSAPALNGTPSHNYIQSGPKK